MIKIGQKDCRGQDVWTKREARLRWFKYFLRIDSVKIGYKYFGDSAAHNVHRGEEAKEPPENSVMEAVVTPQ